MINHIWNEYIWNWLRQIWNHISSISVIIHSAKLLCNWKINSIKVNWFFIKILKWIYSPLFGINSITSQSDNTSKRLSRSKEGKHGSTPKNLWGELNFLSGKLSLNCSTWLPIHKASTLRFHLGGCSIRNAGADKEGLNETFRTICRSSSLIEWRARAPLLGYLIILMQLIAKFVSRWYKLWLTAWKDEAGFCENCSNTSVKNIRKWWKYINL